MILQSSFQLGLPLSQGSAEAGESVPKLSHMCVGRSRFLANCWSEAPHISMKRYRTFERLQHIGIEEKNLPGSYASNRCRVGLLILGLAWIKKFLNATLPRGFLKEVYESH